MQKLKQMAMRRIQSNRLFYMTMIQTKITIIPMQPPRKEERTFFPRDPLHYGRKRATLAKYGIKGRGAVSA